ncbi:MAG: glycosyltransferase [Pirellulaceae bacterium]|nr:glycosyltransferase [Pirellulaceae bacterium]
MHTEYRVFIGPVEVAGYYHHLYAGLQSLGVNCDLVEYRPHRFRYGTKIKTPMFVRWSQQLAALTSGKKTWRTLAQPVEKLCLVLFAAQAIFRYNVFVFGFGKSLLPANLDLPILKLLGKRVIMNLGHGSEARPTYFNGAEPEVDGRRRMSVVQLKRKVKRRRRLVQRLERLVDYCVGAPYTSQFAHRPMINWFALGVPFQLPPLAGISNSNDVQLDSHQRPVLILHSPSHQAAKGTALIRAAIERLRAKGYDIDYREIVGRPNSEVLHEIANCDLVVDQLYSDTPLAGFATEAASFGKPVVVGGYALGELQQFVPEGMWPPSLVCHPNQLDDAIEQLLVDSQLRVALGHRLRQFMASKWTAEQVAERYLQLFAGNVNKDWWLQPSQIHYVQGYGQDESVTQDRIARLVKTHGACSLQLAHHPALQSACLKFAGVAPSTNTP